MNNIQRVYISHTLNTVAMSVIGIYVPIYLLTLGNPLERVIYYFAISHIIGLLFCFLVVVPLMRRWGVINTFKLNYPLQILYLLLLTLMQFQSIPIELVAVLYGIANFTYWTPLNILFLRHSDQKDMGNNLAKFYALPQLFGIVGPLIGALLIPLIGFWPVFTFTAIGIFLSFIPLAKIKDSGTKVHLNFSKAWKRISRNKTLFVFEGIDNVLEESNWFWGIYVFLLIGSLATPGIVGSASAIGGALFTLVVGKYANRHHKKLIPIAAVLMLGVESMRIIVTEPIPAYVVTLVGSFVFTFFLVSYFTTIYRTIKNDAGEEFIILREIPTVLGRLVVFGAIYLSIANLKYFFFLPIVFITLLLILYYWKRKILH